MELTVEVLRMHSLSLGLLDIFGADVLDQVVLGMSLWLPVCNSALVCSIHVITIVGMSEPLAGESFSGCQARLLVEVYAALDEVLGSSMDLDPVSARVDSLHAAIIILHGQPDPKILRLKQNVG